MKSKHHKNGRAAGFTLIEHIVVIAIIAMSGVILSPVLFRVRELNRRSSCQSNLKQIGIGFAQYVQDYDKKSPVFSHNTDSTGWTVNLQPYLKSEQIFQCPSEITPPPKGGDLSTRGATIGFTDYAYNLSLGFDPTVAAYTPRGLPLSAVTHPAITVLAIDFIPNISDSWTIGCTNNWLKGPGCPVGLAVFSGTGTAQRHLEGQNTLLVDGHVKWYKAQSGTTSASIYSFYTPSSTSGQNPTFRFDA